MSGYIFLLQASYFPFFSFSAHCNAESLSLREKNFPLEPSAASSPASLEQWQRRLQLTGRVFEFYFWRTALGS
jgi:hypothetical protein